jgi:hypothetical protein
MNSSWFLVFAVSVFFWGIFSFQRERRIAKELVDHYLEYDSAYRIMQGHRKRQIEFVEEIATGVYSDFTNKWQLSEIDNEKVPWEIGLMASYQEWEAISLRVAIQHWYDMLKIVNEKHFLDIGNVLKNLSNYLLESQKVSFVMTDKSFIRNNFSGRPISSPSTEESLKYELHTLFFRGMFPIEKQYLDI